jgi:glycosyltransferase involved in cell wall biosynthesis
LIAAIMRILLVGNYPLDNQASMLRYVDMLCQQIALRGHQVEIVRPKPFFGNLFTQPVLRKWFGYIDKYLLFPAKLRSLSRTFDLVHVCDHSNSMYLPHTGGRPTSITCHDLLGIASAQGRYPEQNISYTGKVLQWWILKHLSAARNVVCVSANTASELAGLTGRAAQNISVIPNPLNLQYSPAPEDAVLCLRKGLGLAPGEPYLFHIGGDLWYKNRFGVIRIFHQLIAKLRTAGVANPRLIMAGTALWPEMRDYITAHNLQSNVIEIVNPSNENLRTLYSGAAALLFPSLYEGFGWPLIEAQSCGCPVITSNRPPMNEVAGDAALYIDPAEEVTAADLIAANFDQLPLLRPSGLRNAERFHPDQIFPLYERLFIAIARGETLPATVVIAQNDPVAKE